MAKVYEKAVGITLRFYEQVVLPPSKRRVSLINSKRQEFRERKQLLNPIMKTQLLEEATDEERARLQRLEKVTNFQNLQSFDYSYDRHKDLYGFRTRNFPASYQVNESVLEYARDPDFSVKFELQRINLKKWLLFLLLGFTMLKHRERQVNKYDHLKRQEQRAMQNKEVEEFSGKKVFYRIYRPVADGAPDLPESYKEPLEKPELAYQILWLDSKMKNYELLQEFLHKKRIIRAQIQAVLVVDSPVYLPGILQVWERQPVKGATVALQRELTDQEKLLKAFDSGDDQGELIELELKKGFFYLVNPEGEVVDCAKIYSFLHEDNIFQRLFAKISQDIDKRASQAPKL